MQVKIELIAKDAMARVSVVRSFSPVGQPSLVPSTGGCQLQAGLGAQARREDRGTLGGGVGQGGKQ